MEDITNLLPNLLEYIGHIKLGVLYLGLFVGVLLGFGLSKSGQTLKAVLTAIGAALGGGPVLFMKDIGTEKWIYPLGLVIGLIWPRIITARDQIAEASRRSSGEQRVHGWFAWIDLIVIAGVTIAATLYALFVE